MWVCCIRICDIYVYGGCLLFIYWWIINRENITEQIKDELFDQAGSLFRELVNQRGVAD